MAIDIRLAQASDSSSINIISNALGYEFESDAVALNRLNVLLDSTVDLVWVATQNNQILGWIHAFIANKIASASFIEIGGLAVCPESRRQGIASNLVFQAKIWARDQDLELRVRCNDIRVDAHKFYRSCDFTDLKKQAVFLNANTTFQQ